MKKGESESVSHCASATVEEILIKFFVMEKKLAEKASAKNLRQRSVLKVTRGKAAGAPFIVFIRLK